MRTDQAPSVDHLPELPREAFRKHDVSPDPLFYAAPRFVTHIDDTAIAAVTDLYRDVLPPGGAILDLMSSWVSHLPDEVPYAAVIGHGLNPQELAANSRLTASFVGSSSSSCCPAPDGRGHGGNRSGPA